MGRFEIYLSFTRIELESVPSIFIVNNEFVKFIKINKNEKEKLYAKKIFISIFYINGTVN